MAGLTLVLPTFTASSPGPTYTVPQLAFAAVAALVLWAAFVFVQTVRHRDYFLPCRTPPTRRCMRRRRRPASPGELRPAAGGAGRGDRARQAAVPAIEAGVAAVGAPKAVIGIAIALLVLLPETWAAVRAARANRLQTSFNLAFGSALASIGLTIPTVAVASVVLGLKLQLGLGAKDLVLLVLTFLIGTITIATGRTNMMQGAVHLVMFAAFVFLAFVP